MINWWYAKMEGPWAHYLANFLGGFMLSTVTGHYFGLTNGLIIGVIAAIAKEIMDKITGKGTPQILAAIVTTAGAYLAFYILSH